MKGTSAADIDSATNVAASAQVDAQCMRGAALVAICADAGAADAATAAAMPASPPGVSLRLRMRLRQLRSQSPRQSRLLLSLPWSLWPPRPPRPSP